MVRRWSCRKNKCRDKLFKKFKKSKLHIEFYIKNFFLRIKKIFFFWLNDSIGKPKKLWKALKSLGLHSITSICVTIALKVKNTTIFEIKSTLDIFKNYYSTLADNLLKKLPTSRKKYTFNSVIQYYRHFIQIVAFHLTYTT